MTASNIWESVLEHVREELDSEEFRRWFSETAYASDSGDQITVWIHSEADRRHVEIHYQHLLDRALFELGRGDTDVRFVVTGYGEEDEDES
jgi:chromosomal replication initiation ATPase DnaA